MSWLTALLRVYFLVMIGTLVAIPIGYALNPVLYVVDNTPRELGAPALQLMWYLMIAIVAGWLIEDWLPEAARQENSSRPPLRRRLQDLAPWLRSVEVAEYEAEAPALSPPPKSLPAPGRD